MTLKTESGEFAPPIRPVLRKGFYVTRTILVTEVAMTGKHHSDAVFVRCLNYLFVANGSARLDDCLNAIFCQRVNIVTEREECI